MTLTDRTERPDLLCPRCAGNVLQRHGVHSCENYWNGAGDRKCWVCASPEIHMERVTDVPGQLDLFGAAS